MLLVLSLCVVPTVLSASASPYKQHTVLDVTVTLEPRPLCKLTRFLFGRSCCLLDVDLSAISFFALHKYLLTNQPLPTTVEAIIYNVLIAHPTRVLAHEHTPISRAYCYCVACLGGVESVKQKFTSMLLTIRLPIDQCKHRHDSVRISLPNLLNKSLKIFPVCYIPCAMIR